MPEQFDREFDWVAALAFGSGVVVVLPSMTALLVALGAVLVSMF